MFSAGGCEITRLVLEDLDSFFFRIDFFLNVLDPFKMRTNHLTIKYETSKNLTPIVIVLNTKCSSFVERMMFHMRTPAIVKMHQLSI